MPGLTVPPLRWAVQPPPEAAATARLAAELRLPVPLAGILVQRGLASPTDARRFLRPSLDDLVPPEALRDLARAADLVAGAVRAGRTILVHGDYDVDGQCASAILVRALRAAGGRVEAFLPHRIDHGYDFGPAGVAEARRCGASLVLTADCGIRAVEAVRAARDAGLEVVVTDHHLPGPVLPDAHAVVDPQRPDDDSGLGMLCGAGIAFKLVQALVPRLGLPAHLPMHLLDLVALATVADLVPLVGENRILVRHGLRVLAATRWPGVRALLTSAGLDGSEVRAGQAGFTLAPRLNAAGRLGTAMDGLELLLTDDPARAATLAAQLEQVNTRRQELDRRTLDDAIRRVEADLDPGRDLGVVLASPEWHPGVIGIVASRLVERFGRPTFLVALDGDVGKGSGRSVRGVDLHATLEACGDLLVRHGGHRMAAGLTIRADQLEAFRERFSHEVARQLGGAEPAPEQRVDLELPLGAATEDLERLARHLEPCGMGNPGPVFGVRGARLSGARTVGANHLKAVLESDGTRLDAIAFQWADRLAGIDLDTVDVAYRLERNEWNGRSALQARVVALSPAHS